MINFDINDKRKIIISIVITLVFLISFGIYLYLNRDIMDEYNFNEIILADSENEINEVNDEENNIEEQEEEIVVHVTGEVKKEGIVYLKQGSRVVDAIEQAGGETSEADLSQINLAYVLSDGQKIYVPSKNEEISEYITEGSTGISTSAEEASGKININTADEATLDSLPGIGPSTAQKIINYREENGKFNSIEEIKNVSGIGDSKYEEIKDKITV